MSTALPQVPPRTCPHPIRCELEGCHAKCTPPAAVAAAVPALVRQPIELAPLQPASRLEAAFIRWHDSLERRFGPRRAAPAAPSPPLLPLMEELLVSDPEMESLAATIRDLAPPPVKPAAVIPPADTTVKPQFPPAPRCSEVRARRIGSGWLVYIDGKEVEIATDGTLGPIISALVAAK